MTYQITMAGRNLSGGRYATESLSHMGEVTTRVQLCGFRCRAFRYHPCCRVSWGSRSYWLRPQRFVQSRFPELLLMTQYSCVETSFKPEGSGLSQVTESGALEEPGGGSMTSYSHSRALFMSVCPVDRHLASHFWGVSILYPSPSGGTHSR